MIREPFEERDIRFHWIGVCKAASPFTIRRGGDTRKVSRRATSVAARFARNYESLSSHYRGKLINPK